MGNQQAYESKALDGGVLQDYEHLSGKKLLAAIKLNSSLRVNEAIEAARVEFVRPTKKKSNSSEYDVLINGMIEYLSKYYDVGEGMLFKKTPIEFCNHCKSFEALQVIESELEKYRSQLQRLSNVTDKPRDRISSDRAKQAKERLKAFQEKK